MSQSATGGDAVPVAPGAKAPKALSVRDTLDNQVKVAVMEDRDGPDVALKMRFLVGPPLPPEFVHIVPWWHELSAARPVGGFGGLSPLSYPDVGWWARLTGRAPTWREVEAILTGDRAFCAVLSGGDYDAEAVMRDAYPEVFGQTING